MLRALIEIRVIRSIHVIRGRFPGELRTLQSSFSTCSVPLARGQGCG
jgi:hypothetical protein